jgi:hypothetical protein
MVGSSTEVYFNEITFERAWVLAAARPGGRSPVPGEEFVDALHRVVG